MRELKELPHDLARGGIAIASPRNSFFSLGDSMHFGWGFDLSLP